MAKKKRTKTTTHPDRDGTVLNVETELMIATKSTIESLCAGKHDTRQKVSRANDAFSKRFGTAVEKDHVNRRAANIAFNLNELDDEALHETLYHLFFYIKDMGLLDRAKKQEELFSAAETGPAPKLNGHAKDDEGGDDQTTRIGAAARKVAENAGATLQE